MAPSLLRLTLLHYELHTRGYVNPVSSPPAPQRVRGGFGILLAAINTKVDGGRPIASNGLIAGSRTPASQMRIATACCAQESGLVFCVGWLVPSLAGTTDQKSCWFPRASRLGA